MTCLETGENQSHDRLRPNNLKVDNIQMQIGTTRSALPSHASYQHQLLIIPRFKQVYNDRRPINPRRDHNYRHNYSNNNDRHRQQDK